MEKINIQSLYPNGWSIDKIKLRYLFYDKKDVERIVNFIEYDTRVCKRWESANFLNCKMNYNIEIGNSIVYVGLTSNNLKDFQEAQKIIVIEYNPNKVNPFEAINYLRSLMTLPVQRRKVMYLDLTYDMYCKINDIKVHDRRSNSYHCEVSHNDIETIYYGAFGLNGSARLYNKTQECNGVKSETVDIETGEVVRELGDKYYGDLTRYEIRIKPGVNWLAFNVIDPFLIKEYVKLHKITICSYDDKILKNIEDNYKGVDFVNLFAIFNGYDNKLSYRAKVKYNNILDNIRTDVYNSVDKFHNHLDLYNYDEAAKCIRNYLDSIITKSENEFSMSEIK